MGLVALIEHALWPRELRC